MGVIFSDIETNPDTLRMPISIAYLQGRQAYANGAAYDANPYGYKEAMNRLDWEIGHSDAADCVSVEFRQLAESKGERL